MTNPGRASGTGSEFDHIPTLIAGALDPSRLLQDLRSISVHRPLAARLVDVVDAFDAYYGRVRANLDAVRDSLTALVPDTGAAGEHRPFSRDDLPAAGRLPEVRQAVAELLVPDQQHLRLPADVLADAFLGMSLGAARTPHPDRVPLPTEQLVDLFLYGAWTAADTP